MKILCGLVLAGLLMFGISTTSQDKPAPIVEYDLGSCGGRDFTVEHIVVDKQAKTMAFDYFMPSPDQVQKSDYLLVLTEYKENVEKNGDLTFQADTDYLDKDEKKIYHFTLRGVQRGSRVIAVFTVNDKIGRLYYGTPGKIDDMVSVVSQRAQFCEYLHKATDPENLIEKLNEFLIVPDHGDNKT